MNWSGGKDAALALHKVLQEKVMDVSYLLTSLSEAYDRISMHGVRSALLEKQSQSIGIDLVPLKLPEPCDLKKYEEIMGNMSDRFKRETIRYSIFGDIFLEDIRTYRETQLAGSGISPVFPLWKLPSEQVIREFLDSGFKAVLVCVNAKKLGREFVGRELDESLINDLPKDVDLCGENGEYHSFVYDGPIFKHPIKIKRGEITYREYKGSRDGESWESCHYYCDLLPG